MCETLFLGKILSSIISKYFKWDYILSDDAQAYFGVILLPPKLSSLRAKIFLPGVKRVRERRISKGICSASVL